jgi:hypothetical protein
MNHLAIVFTTMIVAALPPFIWIRTPPAIVLTGVSLAVFFTGILRANQALGGFADPIVIFISSLFVVAAGLEASGITIWSGQFII